MKGKVKKDKCSAHQKPVNKSLKVKNKKLKGKFTQKKGLTNKMDGNRPYPRGENKSYRKNYCTICSLGCKTEKELLNHQMTARHHGQIEKIEKRNKNPGSLIHHCPVCNMQPMTMSSWLLHAKGKNHLDNLTEVIKEMNTKRNNSKSDEENNSRSSSRENNNSKQRGREENTGLARMLMPPPQEDIRRSPRISRSNSNSDNISRWKDLRESIDPPHTTTTPENEPADPGPSRSTWKDLSQQSTTEAEWIVPCPGISGGGGGENGNGPTPAKERSQSNTAEDSHVEQEEMQRTEQLLEQSRTIMANVREQRDVDHRRRRPAFVDDQPPPMRPHFPHHPSPYNNHCPFPSGNNNARQQFIPVHYNSYPRQPRRPPPQWEDHHHAQHNFQQPPAEQWSFFQRFPPPFLLPTPTRDVPNLPTEEPTLPDEEVQEESNPPTTNKSIPDSVRQNLLADATAKRGTASTGKLDTRTLMRMMTGPPTQREKRLLDDLARQGSSAIRRHPSREEGAPQQTFSSPVMDSGEQNGGSAVDPSPRIVIDLSIPVKREPGLQEYDTTPVSSLESTARSEVTVTPPPPSSSGSATADASEEGNLVKRRRTGATLVPEDEDLVRMKRAMELTVSEKEVEKSILDQREVVEALERDLEQLIKKAGVEKEKMDILKQRKRELRSERMSIFSELSSQPLSDCDEENKTAKKQKKKKKRSRSRDPTSIHNNTLSDASEISNTTTPSHHGEEGEAPGSSQTSQFGDQSVREIIRKVIFSEKSKTLNFSDLGALMSEYSQDEARHAPDEHSEPIVSSSGGEEDPATRRKRRKAASAQQEEEEAGAVSDVLSTPRGEDIPTPVDPLLEKKRRKKKSSADTQQPSSSSAVADTTCSDPPSTTSASEQHEDDRQHKTKKKKKLKATDSNNLPSSCSSSEVDGHLSVIESEKNTQQQAQTECPVDQSYEDDADGVSITTGELQPFNGSAILDMAVYKNSIFTCSQEPVVKRYSLKTHECECIYRGHSAMVHCLLITDRPRGVDRLFTGGFDSLLVAFHALSGKELQRIPFESQIHCLASEWDQLFLGLGSGRVFIFDLARNRTTGNFRVSDKAVSCLTAAREGARRILIIGCHDNSITIRDAASGLLLRNIDAAHQTPPVGMSTLGYRVLSYSDKTVHSHIYTDGLSDRRIALPITISSMFINKQHLSVGCVDGSVRIFDVVKFVPNAKPTQVYYMNKRVPVMSIVCVGEILIAANKEGTVYVIQMTNKSLQCMFGTCSEVFGSRDDLIYHVTRDHVLATSEDLVICAWRGCNYKFTSSQGVKSIEEHIEGHV